MSFPINHISPNEIVNSIQRLKPKKFLGYDLITNKILKNIPKKAIILPTYIYIYIQLHAETFLFSCNMGVFYNYTQT
jgi:hypothetical protein